MPEEYTASERRDYFKEDDVLLNKKVKKAIEGGLITPILCCGGFSERESMGVTLDLIRLQIKSDLVRRCRRGPIALR